MALPLVSIGEAQERDAAYLRQVKSLRNVTCLGSYAHDDPMLASAYAAAAVFALPSQGEQYPLTVIEALAAGTPALVGQQCTLDVAGAGVAWRRIGWNTVAEQQAAVSALIERPPARAGVSALVRDHTWDSVAVQLLACYRELLAPSQRGPGRPGSPATLLADA
jgi:glycosyltransferase involved in cell wall biosynthesis